jgi:hypothetical protein
VPTLTDTSHEHHGRIKEHVDRLPGIADLIGRTDEAALRAAFLPEAEFITGRLVRHMNAVETTFYGPLERLMVGRHSMAPMRHEHEELLRLVDALGDYAATLRDGSLAEDDQIGLRRALYRLHGIVNVHLAEEELYLGVLERNLTEAEKDEVVRMLVRACEQPL